jgi:hypothetical protein
MEKTKTIKINFEKQLTPFTKAIKGIDYREFRITSEATLDEGVNGRIKIKHIADDVSAAKRSILDPINLAVKNIRAMFDPLEIILEKQDRYLYDEIQKWRQTKLAEAAKKEEELTAKIRAGEISLKDAGTKLEKVEAKLDNIPTRNITRLRITDATKIPGKYLIPDTAAIFKALKAGEKIPGAELYQDPIIVRG